MKRKNNILRRSLAWFLGFGVLFSSLPLGAVGETSAPVQGSMSGMGDMASMMEQYQQFMGGGSDVDMSEMMEQYQALMGGGSGGDMTAMLEQMPEDILTMGNVDPVGTLRNGTPESVRTDTLAVLEACSSYPNFLVSSGCDIPPGTPWENLDAFFAAVAEYYTV